LKTRVFSWFDIYVRRTRWASEGVRRREHWCDEAQTSEMKERMTNSTIAIHFAPPPQSFKLTANISTNSICPTTKAYLRSMVFVADPSMLAKLPNSLEDIIDLFLQPPNSPPG